MLSSSLPINHLCQDIKRHIRSLTGVIVDDLQVEADGHQVILTGRARRYFHKQQATRAAQEVLGKHDQEHEQSLLNEIEVF